MPFSWHNLKIKNFKEQAPESTMKYTDANVKFVWANIKCKMNFIMMKLMKPRKVKFK